MGENEKDIFTKRLRSLRDENEYNQERMAGVLGVSRSTYTGYELGTIEPPKGKLIILSDFFEVSIDYLLGRTNYRNQQEMLESLNNDSSVETIAAHFDGDEYTEVELKKIKEFAAFVKANRDK